MYLATHVLTVSSLTPVVRSRLSHTVSYPHHQYADITTTIASTTFLNSAQTTPKASAIKQQTPMGAIGVCSAQWIADQ